MTRAATCHRTIKQNCRRCYTCVRACPAEAIRIEDGQAVVVTDRCIACGNCTLVCSQDAKAYYSGVEQTPKLLDGPAPVAALLAPSFPAGFAAPAGHVVGAFKAAGFDLCRRGRPGCGSRRRRVRAYLEAHPRVCISRPRVRRWPNTCASTSPTWSRPRPDRVAHGRDRRRRKGALRR